jgi:hypothetical protein
MTTTRRVDESRRYAETMGSSGHGGSEHGRDGESERIDGQMEGRGGWRRGSIATFCRAWTLSANEKCRMRRGKRKRGDGDGRRGRFGQFGRTVGGDRVQLPTAPKWARAGWKIFQGSLCAERDRGERRKRLAEKDRTVTTTNEEERIRFLAKDLEHVGHRFIQSWCVRACLLCM